MLSVLQAYFKIIYIIIAISGMETEGWTMKLKTTKQNLLSQRPWTLPSEKSKEVASFPVTFVEDKTLVLPLCFHSDKVIYFSNLRMIFESERSWRPSSSNTSFYNKEIDT